MNDEIKNPPVHKDYAKTFDVISKSDVEPGYYRHYKGGHYRVVGMALNADDHFQGDKRVHYENAEGQRFDRAVEQWHKPAIVDHELLVRYFKVDYVPAEFKSTMQCRFPESE